MLTWLRIVVSCFCLVLCVLFAALWIRSWFGLDMIRITDGTTETTITSNYGNILFQQRLEPSAQPEPFSVFSASAPAKVFRPQSHSKMFGFSWRTIRTNRGLDYNIRQVPHWIIFVPAGLLAIALRTKPRWRFSLGELAGLVTLTAIEFGFLAYLF